MCDDDCSSPPRRNDPHVLGSTLLGEGEYLRLEQLQYRLEKDPSDAAPRYWDSVSRVPAHREDVQVIAWLRENEVESRSHDLDRRSLILISQFRPPVGKTCIEFPAGYIDADESPELAALRELREETGYRGSVCRVSSQMYHECGCSSFSGYIVGVEVNELGERELEDTEEISVHLIPMRDLKAWLKDAISSRDWVISAALATYVFALDSFGVLPR